MVSEGFLLNAPVSCSRLKLLWLQNAQNQTVLGFLLRTFPNIEAVSLTHLTLCHTVDFLCCLVSLSIFRMVSSETVRLALNASTVIRKAAALGGVGFEGAVVLLSQ